MPSDARAMLAATSLLLPLLGTCASADEASVDAGRRVFITRCMACHRGEEGSNKIGPSLFAVVGRPSASVAGFNYSMPMRDARLTWSESQLDTYLKNPRAVVPGTRMTFVGLPDEIERRNVIAYLKTLHK